MQKNQETINQQKDKILTKNLTIEFTPVANAKKIVSKEEYEKSISKWGLLTSIDLDDYNPELITNAEKIKQYVKELCQLIDMKRYGDTQVVYFGDDPKVAGFSMTQLIETSLISAHFGSGTTKYAYIDVFSCKWYDQKEAFEFTKNFFKAEKSDFNVVLRGKDIQ